MIQKNVVILSKLEYYVIEKINKGECFSVLADETSDILGIERFTLGVRYTCCKCSDTSIYNVRESFFGICTCS